jgi:transcriptional regulator with XRE-family HTH domain
MSMQEIGARIRARREYLGRSQQDVADAIHKERSAYASYELGRTEPSAETIENLASVLRTKVGYLYGEISDDEAGDHEIMLYYRGLPPTLKPAARAALKAMHDAQDEEDGGGTIGRRAE